MQRATSPWTIGCAATSNLHPRTFINKPLPGGQTINIDDIDVDGYRIEAPLVQKSGHPAVSRADIDRLSTLKSRGNRLEGTECPLPFVPDI